MNSLRRRLVIMLVLSTTTIALVIFASRNNNLFVVACDVGQGDAFLVIKGRTQVLIDAGPNEKVLDCLDRYVPFYDRTIELVVMTHPQLDHYGGLLPVFSKYNVDFMLTSGLNASASEYRVLENLVGGSNTQVVFGSQVSSIRLGLMHLEVLNPTKKVVSDNSKAYVLENLDRETDQDKSLDYFNSDKDPNEFSVVMLMSYGQFDTLFTADITPNISDTLANTASLRESSIEYLKVPHHGSKNGLTKSLLDVVSPEIAVISSGKKNNFGHPHKEVLEMLNDEGVRIFRTDESGDVILETDGQRYWVSKSL